MGKAAVGAAFFISSIARRVIAVAHLSPASLPDYQGERALARDRISGCPSLMF
jgi:hypothetical protein